MPANPQNMKHLQEMPRKYLLPKTGDQFLLYNLRLIVFTTKHNVELLIESSASYVDGTFKSVRSIFYQLLTILGLKTYVHGVEERRVATPLVYALLESKEEIAYSKVFEKVIEASNRFGCQF